MVDSGSCSWVNQEILTGDRMRNDSHYIAQTELTKLTKDEIHMFQLNNLFYLFRFTLFKIFDALYDHTIDN